MNKNIIVYILLSLLIFSGCAKKVVFKFESSNNLLIKKIKEANLYPCNFKGKAVINYEDRLYKVKFKSLFNKKCDRDAKFYILGVLNSIAAEIDIEDGKVIVKKAKEDVSSDLRNFLNNVNASSLIGLLNIPYKTPFDVKDKKVQGENLILVDNKGVIFTVDRNYKIISIKKGENEIKYNYSGKTINSIEFKGKETHLLVTFI
ncbi:hypothetical protein DEFDS_0459 [Deferribacter desulfuricans SSM1]|uniref:Lipoprotein n=1 Tax=Deferribacter desulfuricans (strain DSM 14783 / JCM 11476 / NBRC 101012 / SSM1) TaxID=639282 RepID=D3PBI0_DEFDS|nr:hypothetical protein [Deferribacter desulfuricans]BAI79953.1 hypothetical protein DEFDS_0459 [Deferribacter desulfuricans SSM1]